MRQLLPTGRLRRRNAFSSTGNRTVFAGKPASPLITEWDKASGFADAHEALRVGRREDARALAVRGAEPLWLDFLDAQYGATLGVEGVADTLAGVFTQFGAYLPVCPLGLWHSDLESHRGCVPDATANAAACALYRV